MTACPGVSALFGGRGDTIASYLPGRRVPGVEVPPTAVTIHVRSRWGVSAPQLLAQIAAAVSPLRHGKRLQVVVADIDDPDPPAQPAPPAQLVAALPVPPEPVQCRSRSSPRRSRRDPPGSAPPPSAEPPGRAHLSDRLISPT